MTRHPLHVTLRAVLLLAGCVAAGLGSWSLARGPLVLVGRPVLDDGPGALPATGFPDLVAGTCALALLGCAAWVLVTTGFVVLTRLAELLVPGSPAVAGLARAAERACPTLARGLAVTVLGLGLGTAAATPTLADPAAPSGPHDGSGGLTGLRLPDRTTGGVAGPGPGAARAVPASRPGRVVVVHPGDSLWSIAAGLLPAGADDGRVTVAWHRLHRANASRVGPDPDLILPGTRLVVPGLGTPHSAHTSEERQ